MVTKVSFRAKNLWPVALSTQILVQQIYSRIFAPSPTNAKTYGKTLFFMDLTE